MSNKTATTLTAAEVAVDNLKWNKDWTSRLGLIVAYPCAGVVVISFMHSVTYKTPWLLLPGAVMFLYALAYLSFAQDRISPAWMNWIARNRKSNNPPRGLWRIHTKIHTVFIKRQKAILWGTSALSVSLHFGVPLFIGLNYFGEVDPDTAMLRLIIWGAIAAGLSLWASYIITHQEWAENDAYSAWSEARRETLDEVEAGV